MKAIIFCGYHKTGKTTLMTRAVRALVRRGYTVATVKHSPGLVRDASSDGTPAGTDSEKLLHAGSESTILVTHDQVFLTKKLDIPANDVTLQDSESHNAVSIVNEVLKHVDADYALIEGFKSYTGSIAKLLFVHTPRDLAELDEQGAVAYTGVSSLDGWSTSIPFLPPSSGDDDLADFVIQHARELQNPASM